MSTKSLFKPISPKIDPVIAARLSPVAPKPNQLPVSDVAAKGNFETVIPAKTATPQEFCFTVTVEVKNDAAKTRSVLGVDERMRNIESTSSAAQPIY
jgi:hypothetical protein